MNNSRIARTAKGALLGASIALLPAAAAANPPSGSGPAIVVTGKPAAPNMRGTVALPARLSTYSAGWERARRAATGDPRLVRLIAPARSLAQAQQLAYVQAAVHRDIGWISDATQYNRRDYWASASETLARGRGDGEDRAILKMEALKNLGVPARDLFMTVGTDKVAGPVTVLVVKVGNQLMVLDDSGGAPYPVEQRPDFEPMMTLGHGASWLHGRRRAAPQLAANRPGGAAVPPQSAARR